MGFRAFGKFLLVLLFYHFFFIIFTFFLEYQNAYGLVTVSENRMSDNNVLLELWPKKLSRNQNAGFKL